MILTNLLSISIILFILIRIPNQYENDFSRNLLQSISGNSKSPKNVRKQFDSFIWGLIIIFLSQYIIFNFIINN